MRRRSPRQGHHITGGRCRILGRDHGDPATRVLLLTAPFPSQNPLARNQGDFWRNAQLETGPFQRSHVVESMYAVSWIACVGSGMAQARCRRYDVAPHLRPSGLVASTALHSCPSILARFQSPRQFFACEIHRKGPVCPFGKAKPRSQCYREAVQPRTSQRGGPPSFASLNLPRVANCGNSVRRQTTHPSRSAERHSDTAKQRSLHIHSICSCWARPG